MQESRTPIPPRPFEVEGRRMIPLGRGTVLRDDRMVGVASPWNCPKTLDGFRWYTPQQICEIAGGWAKDGTPTPLPLAQMIARIKDRWSWSDMIKGPFWERVVDARRNGIEYKGKRQSLQEWADELGASVDGLEVRLSKDWALPEVLVPGKPRKGTNRVQSTRCPPGVPSEPRVSTKGNVIGLFYYNGAVDNFVGHCKAAGMNPHTVRSRMRKGISFDAAVTVRRFPRSDAGKPNPKRSPRYWDAGYVPPEDRQTYAPRRGILKMLDRD